MLFAIVVIHIILKYNLEHLERGVNVTFVGTDFDIGCKKNTYIKQFISINHMFSQKLTIVWIIAPLIPVRAVVDERPQSNSMTVSLHSTE